MHTKKEFGRTLRGKSGFPSVPQGTEGRCPCEPFTLLGKTVRLSRYCFAEVVIRGARAAIHSELDNPARRDLFLLCRSSFVQAKDLCRKLSNNDNITLSPAVGGRKKRNGESGQLQRLNPQKQIGRTFSGENSLFSPLARSSSRRQTPITLFRETRHSAVCVSQRSRTKERGLWFTPNYISGQTRFVFA